MLLVRYSIAGLETQTLLLGPKINPSRASCYNYRSLAVIKCGMSNLTFKNGARLVISNLRNLGLTFTGV
jgi:hypothetical protein